MKSPHRLMMPGKETNNLLTSTSKHVIDHQTILCLYLVAKIFNPLFLCTFIRDEAQAKMILLKERADKDQQQHNAEMKELLRIIDHDRNLREFMGIKGQERVDDPQLVAWRQKKGELTSF